MDPGLHEIYAKETAGHLAAIRKFIISCQLANAPYAVTEDLHRACHTLSGTAKTAGARQGIKIAEPLNRYIRKLYDNSIGLPQPGLQALTDAVAAIQQVVDHITENTGFFLDHGRVVKRLNELEHELDLDISRLAETLSTTANSSYTAGDTTGEHLLDHHAATTVNEGTPSETFEIEEVSLSADDVLEGDILEDAVLESNVFEADGVVSIEIDPGALQPVIPEPAAPEEVTLDSTLTAPEEITLDSAADGNEEITFDSTLAPPEEVTLDSTTDGNEEITFASTLAGPEEVTLDSAADGNEEITFDSTLATPEEVTLDSTTDGNEEITFASTLAGPEEITLDSTVTAPEEITLQSTADDDEHADGVIELESTDASALNALAWSYQNFPANRSPADSDAHDLQAAAATAPSDMEALAGEAIVLEASADDLLAQSGIDAAGIVVDDAREITIDVTSRSLLQMNEPLPDDASDIASDMVIETAAWAADFEPPVLPVDAAPAMNRDEAETIRSPLLRPAAPEALPDDSLCLPLDATRAFEVAPTLMAFDDVAAALAPSAAEAVEPGEGAPTLMPLDEVAGISPAPAAAEPAEPEMAPWAASIEIEPSALSPIAPAEAIETAPPAAPVAAQAEPAPIEEEEYDDSDFDAEVASIFTEEASELLETADHSLSSWVRDRANSALVFELKRVVHTLKGGARMAGIRAMGDLTHELETLMGLVESGDVPAEQKVFDVLQSSLDELHRMRDMVANGERCKSARGLMNRIRALCGQEPEPAAASAPAPVAAAPAAPIVAPPAAPEPIAELSPEPVAAAEPPVEAVVEAEEVEVIEYTHGEVDDFGSRTDIVPTLTEIEALAVADDAADVEVTEPEAAEVEAAADVADVSDIEAEFGADELGAVAPREAVRVEEPPASAANVASAATGIHAAIDVATLAPELAPDADQEEVAAEPQAPALPGRDRPVQERQEFARVDADLLDNLLNNAGEVSIFRSRMEQQVSSIEFNLAELGRTVTRLKDQLRKLEMETEAQILHRHQEEHPDRADFDPLELDRYSTIQQLTRAFAESVSDVSSIEGLLENLTREAQNLLLQQSRVVTEMQNGLMRTRMVPFQRHVQRLSRLVRQVASDTGKRADLVVVGASGELDRQVLERMLPPFEHMLRNSVVHGIETPEERAAAGKSPQGTIKVGLHREGSEMVIVLEDDGRGIDVNAVRERARVRGLLQPGRVLSDEEAMQLILEPGFSTASNITQHAGRGVGMDVVVNEIKKLGGALFTQSEPGQGVKFTIRLPFTLAITQALIVRTGDELYALPLPSVEGVARVPKSEVQKHLAEENPTYNYGGQIYRLQHLGAFVGGGPSALPEMDVSVPLILIRAGEHSTAIVTDELVGSREMVVKSVGPQIATIRGIAGATILGDGRIVIILDMGALVRSEWRGGRTGMPVETGPKVDKRTFVLVVDDSITVRRVTQRLLERNGMRVMTAKDGIDALTILQEHVPDVILLDIEMPRMDGYELATQVRADSRLTDIPIVMITSRVGEKHRARAIEIGVNDYLGKPYQENQLLDAIEPLVQARRRKVS